MTERQLIVKHALTILVGQLAVVSFGVADTVIAGRYDPSALAVLSVSAAIYITVYVALLGVLQALLPVFAELHGAKKPLEIGQTFRQALYVWMGLSVIGGLLLVSPEPLLGWTGVPDQLQSQAVQYLSVLAIALPPALFFRLFSSLSQSLGKPRWVTWIQLAALSFKIPLSVLLTFGSDVFAPMGLTGCAVATVIVNYSMVLVALGLLKRQDVYERCRIWAPLETPDWPQIRHLCRLGIPNGLSVTVEVTSFTLMALFIARLGNTAAASHQIASNMAALLYMIPLSFSIAVSARISYWRGAEQWDQMRSALKIGFQLILGLAGVMGLTLWLLNQLIADLYAKDAAVATMAADLLLLIGFYHLFDALQTYCFFVLRSFKVTIAPALVYSLVLWGVGLMGGFQLAFNGLGPIEAQQSAQAFWVMSIAGLSLVSMALLGLLHLHLKRLTEPSNKL
jgi:MATE family multidrug resistance protein